MKLLGVVLLLTVFTFSQCKPLPHKFKFDDQVWTVAKVRKIDGARDAGITYWDTHLILIQSGQPPIEESDTFLHELMHAATDEEFSRRIDFGHNAIYRITENLNLILTQNPEATQYFEHIHECEAK